MIELAGTTEADIRSAGEASYPYECCGVLLGRAGKNGERIIEKLLPIDNAKDDGEKHNRFLITGDDMMKAEKHARSAKLDVLGLYHSHPDHPAVPSQFDLDHALPFYSYVIVSVKEGRSADLFSWILENDRSRFNTELFIKGENA